ncbi:hypothetical protein [Streptomyces sp. NPDC054901]
MTVTNPAELISLAPLTRTGVLPAVSRVCLGGKMIGTITDEGGAIPSRGSHHAWSLAFGPKGFHHNQADAVERLVSVWLNVGWGPVTLMTATGTVHASRTTPEGNVPACMTDRAARELRVLLRSGRAVTCRHCPQH